MRRQKQGIAATTQIQTAHGRGCVGKYVNLGTYFRNTYFCFMKSFEIKILNPKALKLLQNLADLELISFKKQDDNLQTVLKRLRKKASANPPSIKDITKEVEIVRAKRYATKKR